MRQSHPTGFFFFLSFDFSRRVKFLPVFVLAAGCSFYLRKDLFQRVAFGTDEFLGETHFFSGLLRKDILVDISRTWFNPVVLHGHHLWKNKITNKKKDLVSESVTRQLDYETNKMNF
jgi:hypothetical protein